MALDIATVNRSSSGEIISPCSLGAGEFPRLPSVAWMDKSPFRASFLRVLLAQVLLVGMPSLAVRNMEVVPTVLALAVAYASFSALLAHQEAVALVSVRSMVEDAVVMGSTPPSWVWASDIVGGNSTVLR